MESSDQNNLQVLQDPAPTAYLNGHEQPGAESQSLPTTESQQADSMLSPTQASLHPLPAKPATPMFAPTMPNMTHALPVAPQQPRPRVVGGFEVDDDSEDEVEVGAQDGENEADVYNPSEVLDFATPAAADALSNQIPTTLDRSSQSPEQENGFTPLPAQATGSPAEVDPSPSNTVLPSASTDVPAVQAAVATPSYTAPDTPALSAQPATPHPQVNGSLPAALPKSRLAHDVVGILEDRIKDDPRGDIDAYLELIEEFKSRNKQEDVRRVFEDYLKVFPFAAEQWCAYVKFEEAHDRKQSMESLFNRSLMEVLNVQLWSMYINYIRRRNSMQTGDVARSYTIIDQAFSFALKTIGMDKDAGPLWQDYIGFLKTGPGTVGGTSWQDGAKVDTLRAAYQKAIAVPTAATSVLWKEYDAFESGLSKVNGRKNLQEKSPVYMTARTGYTQLQNLTRDLHRTSRPRLPPAAGFQGHLEYLQQVGLWKQWIDWEKEDNLVLKDDEFDVYRSRIIFTYKQALMALQFWPELWYDAVEFCFENDKEEEGLKLLNHGINANPESPLLAFKLADRIEGSTQNDESTDPGAKDRMKKVRDPYDKLLDALYDMTKKVSSREALDIQNAGLAIPNTESEPTEEDENAATVAAQKAFIEARVEAIKQGAQAQIAVLSRVITHAWLAVMRSTRRILGKGQPGEKGPGGFRRVFGEARQRGKLTSDFYVESARIEWQCYRDPAGTKILDRGMKLYPEDDYLPLQYVKHLFDINDITNARAVFETTVKRLLAHENPEQTAKAKPLFAFLHDYESKFGELAQVQSLEVRMKHHFPEDPTLKLFSSRYNTPTFDTMNIHPIISPVQQLQPLQGSVLPSIETRGEVTNSPIQNVIDSITTNSPKRPLPDDFEDGGSARKLQRGESPLKGAAGRRMHQQQPPRPPPAALPLPSFPAPPPALHPALAWFLSILPKASTYVDTRFDGAKMMELMRDIKLPAPGTVPGAHIPPPAPPPQPQQAGWPQYPPQPMPPPGYQPPLPPPPNVSQGQYGAAPFRYV